MKNQALFSLKDKSKELSCHLQQFLFGALRVKNQKISGCLLHFEIGRTFCTTSVYVRIVFNLEGTQLEGGDGWMDDLRVYILFNSASVVLG